MRLLIAALATLAAAAQAAPPPAARWQPLRQQPDGTALFLDAASITRRPDAVLVRYRLDFARPQGDFKIGMYRSLVIRAAVRCRDRSIAVAFVEAYSEPGAKGVGVGISERDGDAFEPVEPGTSDEEVWNRVCRPARAAPRKP